MIQMVQKFPCERADFGMPGRRLIGNGFPPIASPQPPEEILATPPKICRRCKGIVVPEIIDITQGVCWSCRTKR